MLNRDWKINWKIIDLYQIVIYFPIRILFELLNRYQYLF
jgi:hypothetical protein